jgi:S1-C subfamily serine protease
MAIIAYPFIYAQICKTRVYSELAEKISKDVLSANLYLIKQTTDGQSMGYSAGFGGVIFQKDGNQYYALTAWHAVDTMANAELIVLAHDDMTYNDVTSAKDMPIGLSEYYQQFPRAKLMYHDEKYDLAIVCFETADELHALSVSKDALAYGGKVAAISGCEGRNRITYGNIVSKTPVEFGDERGKTQYKVIMHSAYENTGSSGSVLLNESCEIAGINLGGGKDGFGNFKYGLAMPSDRINDFIKDWNKQ